MAGAEELRRRRARFLARRRKEARDATMTMVEHLGELRYRLIVSAATFAVFSVLGFVLYTPISELLTRPLCRVDPELLGLQGCDLIYTAVLGGFQFRLKLAALVGLALASPVWLYQIWAFVIPALTSREQRYALPFLVSAILLFATGAALAYLVLPAGLRFLIAVGGPDLVPLLDAPNYLNFVGLMLIAFGLTFELPLVLIFLGLAGVVSVQRLRRERRTALVAIAVLAAIATPTQDPFTMLGMLIVLYALYEVTILVLSAMTRGREPTE